MICPIFNNKCYEDKCAFWIMDDEPAYESIPIWYSSSKEDGMCCIKLYTIAIIADNGS